MSDQLSGPGADMPPNSASDPSETPSSIAASIPASMPSSEPLPKVPDAAPAVDGGPVDGRAAAGWARWRVPVVLGALGLLAFGVFGLGSAGDAETTFNLSRLGERFQLTPLTVPTRATAIVLSIGCLALAGLATWLVNQRRHVHWTIPAGYALLWIAGFLVWAVTGKSLSLVGLLAGGVLLSVPLIFGSLSGVVCERAGVINIAIEGQLLAGAFLAAVVATLSHSLWVGLVAAPVAGVLVAWVLAVFALRYAVDQIIVGVVLNVLVIGVTGFLYGRLLSPRADTWNSPGIFSPINIPVLGDIPIVGQVLFRQSIIVYLMYVVVIAVQIALFRTRWGLRVRAVGEHPLAADTVGIKVNRVRFQNVLLGGAIAGLGGAFFTIGFVGPFSREMTAGQGFIALAAMIFGRWTPLGAVGAALLFGFANNLQSALGAANINPIPNQFMLMAPYVITIIAVAGLVGRVRAPAADGQPYVKS